MAHNKNLKDGDYVLTENAGWFTVGNCSVRIFGTDTGVQVSICPLGHEDSATLAECQCTFAESQEVIDEQEQEVGA